EQIGGGVNVEIVGPVDVNHATGSAGSELGEVRHDLRREQIDRDGGLRLAHAAEHESAHQIGAAAGRDLALQLFAHAAGGARHRDAARPRLVEVASEADGQRAEISPELGQ